jgi:hypothetical protein
MELVTNVSEYEKLARERLRINGRSRKTGKPSQEFCKLPSETPK